MIREAIEKNLRMKPTRKVSNDLYVSDLGNDPAIAMARVLRGETTTFDIDILEKMQYGNVLEADTIDALRFSHTNVITQFPLFNDVWSGYADAVIGHNFSDVSILEHKATGDKWWDYKESLPRAAHLCQLWMYGRLYGEMYGINNPRLLIYYRSWSHYAEFELWPDGRITGVIDGKPVLRERSISPNLLRIELEEWHSKGIEPIRSSSKFDYAEDANQRLIAASPGVSQW